MAWLKHLWADPETEKSASLIRWNKGYTAPPHVHLHDAHFIMLSGRIAVRDAEYGPGDYGYEPRARSTRCHDDAGGLRLFLRQQRPDPFRG